MLLNAHSTCVMAKMGRVVGNTMTNVSPSNLKLVGRSTFLVLSHVNDKLKDNDCEVAYAQANAVLFESIRYAQESGQSGAVAEVALAIVMILETFKRKEKVEWVEAGEVLRAAGSLEGYLDQYNV